jgi:hypothetical protein
MEGSRLSFTNLEDLPRLSEKAFRRAKNPWWLDLRSIAQIMSQPGPGKGKESRAEN